MTKRILSLLLIFCLLAGFCSGFAESRTTYVVSNTMKAYKKASTSSKVLGVMTYGEKVTCVATSGKWARIKNSSGSIGYCAKDCLSAKNPNTLSAKAYAKTSGVKVYDKPSTSSPVLKKLSKNACCIAVAMTSDGKWLRLKNGKSYGYVQTSKMSKKRTTASSGSSSKATAVVKLANALKGKSYAYASRGPDKFDCSGLAYYVYKKAAGVSLKRTSALQYSDGRFSKITSIGSLKTGDQLFFATGSGRKCDHVGIYIGDGKFVHASSTAGKVIVSSFNSYYKDAFLCGRRIL